MADFGTTFLETTRWLWSIIFVQDLGHRLHWLYLLTFFVLAICLYLIRKPHSTSLISFLIPKKVIASRSSLTDVQIYIFNSGIGTIVNFTSLIASTSLIATGTFHLMNFVFGDDTEQLTSGLAIKVVFGVAFLLLTDFAVFFAHYLHHKLPYLWSFHKTHHSAEVLTPITAFRFHPVELIINGVVLALSVGPLVGIYQYYFDIQFFSSNPTVYVIATFLWLFTANFRHSHIPMHYPKLISCWLVSPAMHNIHHSTAPRHFDKNFGLLFSIWDRLAGTWYLPNKTEKLEFGLVNETSFKTSLQCYFTPFKECYVRIRKLIGRLSRTESS